MQIDWSGLARRARRLTVPGRRRSAGSPPSPEGHSVALTVATGGAGGGRGAGAAADPNAGMYIINVESGQLTRVPPAPRRPPPAPAAADAAAAAAASAAAANMAFARDGRTLYFRSGTGLYAAAVPAGRGRRRGAAAAADAAGRGGGGAGGRGRGPRRRAPRRGRSPTRPTSRSINKALRAQVFNEGWRIMKNRFYDAKMHGADWNGAWETYEPLLDHVVDQEELQTVMMMMIGELNASHTGVSGGGRRRSDRRSRRATRASTSSPTRRASTRSATSTRTARPIATT